MHLSVGLLLADGLFCGCFVLLGVLGGSWVCSLRCVDFYKAPGHFDGLHFSCSVIYLLLLSKARVCSSFDMAPQFVAVLLYFCFSSLHFS